MYHPCQRVRKPGEPLRVHAPATCFVTAGIPRAFHFQTRFSLDPRALTTAKAEHPSCLMAVVRFQNPTSLQQRARFIRRFPQTE